MTDETPAKRTKTGHFSPLRYPGGKGKLARFIRSIILQNGLSDGHYVEPYAGGGAVAWELLCTGIVRRVTINDINGPVHAFWHSVLNRTDDLCAMIEKTPITPTEWARQREIYRSANDHTSLRLGFATFFLNRTNHSGILGAGMIGGNKQAGDYTLDVRFTKTELIKRIRNIARFRKRIDLFNMDACAFLDDRQKAWDNKTLIYLDPPYYEKGRFLYHDAYAPDDHGHIAEKVAALSDLSWIVSYDDIDPIHALYADHQWLRYTLPYSARNKVRGMEAMFFSENLNVPEVPSPLIEINRGACAELSTGSNDPVGRKTVSA